MEIFFKKEHLSFHSGFLFVKCVLLCSVQYRSKLRNHLHAVKPRLCRTCLPRIHRGGTKTATAAKTKATESRGELDAVKIQ